MLRIDRNKLKEAIEKANAQGDLIGSKINKLLEDETLSEQKNLELCQVGKFLTLLEDQNAKIIEQRESPDFIISVDDRMVGLEHEIILNTQNQFQSTKNIFRLAAKEFEKRYPDIKVLANCWLTTNDFNYKQKDKKKIIGEIVEYIYGMTQKSKVKIPDFLDDVIISKHSGVSFSVNNYISNIESLDDLTLSKAIKKKEDLIERYISNSQIKDQWLLLVIGQVSPDSYKTNGLFSSFNSSRFERIYLLEDFQSKKYRIK
jgi:hypothetical protein